MSSWLDYIIVPLFLICATMLAAYALHLYLLVFLFGRKRRRVASDQKTFLETYRANTPDDQWLGVTTQLPIYNEAEVAVRVIEAAAAMDYPAGKHLVQVLDDSTDETRLLVDRTVRRLRGQGVDIEVIRREKRTGYKAGALAEGMARSKHPLAAIFDADFVPPKDFLRRATPFFTRNARLGCVQSRWGHLNSNESWLTKAQAVGLDGHFAIEQGARAWNGLMMNFNGTAGIWRIDAVNDPAVGGWSSDTLTEDLDLSYRAQLAGWKIEFCLDLVCPAELPSTINALKAQQRRWATGSIQTAVKLLPRIWRAPIGLGHKFEATVHLTHYAVAFFMVALALLTRPMMTIAGPYDYLRTFLTGWVLVLLSSLAPPVTYSYARYVLGGQWSGFRTIPALTVLGGGMSINNALAVLRGVFTRGGEFVRTPKSGSTNQLSLATHYRPQKLNWMWLSEMLLGTYCVANWVTYIAMDRFAWSFFLAIYAYAYLAIGWLSRPEAIRPPPSITDDDSVSPTLATIPEPIRAAG